MMQGISKRDHGRFVCGVRRIESAFCGMILALSFSHGLAAEPDGSVRRWQTKAGSYSIEATYVSQNESAVKLARSDGTEIEVVKTRLCTEDNKWLAIAHFREQDQECEQQCQSLRSNLVNDQASNATTLIALHNQYKQSPVAGVLAAVACAAIDNDPKKAVTLLNESNRRITVQREFVPTAHGETLVSVLNNLAVCELKQGRALPAANYFLTALKETGPNASGAVVHNAKLLLDTASAGSNRYQIKSDIVNDLRLRVSQATPPNEIEGHVQLLVFSTLTGELSGDAQGRDMTSDEVVPNLWCLACSGRGFLACLNPKCAGGGVAVKERIVMGQNHLGAAVMGDKVSRIPCSVCDGAGGKRCTICKDGRVRPVRGYD